MQHVRTASVLALWVFAICIDIIHVALTMDHCVRLGASADTQWIWHREMAIRAHRAFTHYPHLDRARRASM